MYDQVYWMLCFRGAEHVTPPGWCRRWRRYTVLVDGVSKAFAATGPARGLGRGPDRRDRRMSAILGHVGAWAPRPEQIATAALLDDEGIRAFHHTFIDGRSGASTRSTPGSSP